MNTYEQFRVRQKRVSDKLNESADILNNVGLHMLATAVGRRADELRAHGFKVAVVGEFSAGKSTLLNALLGESVLPAKMAPCTVANVEIGYGPERRLLVKFRDSDEWKEEPVERLKEFAVIKSFDDEDAKREIEESPVRSIRVEAPLDICRAGVTFIDTPGLNEHQARSSVTQGLLGNVDAAVFLTNATQLWSRSEQEFVKDEAAKAPDLRGWLGHVFVAATFADTALDDEDGEAELRGRMDDFCGSLLEPHGLAPARRYFIDANSVLKRRIGKNARTAGVDFNQMEKDIAQFVVTERGQVMLDNAKQGAIGQLNRALGVLDDEVRADAADAAERRAAAEAARERLETEQTRVSRMVDALRQYGPQLADSLGKELEIAQGRWLRSGLPTYLDKQEYPKTIIRPGPPTEWFTSKASRWLDTQFQAWANEVPSREFERTIAQFEREFRDDLSEFKSALESVSKSLGGLPVSEDTGGEGLSWILRAGAGWLAGGPLGAVIGGTMGWEGLATNFAINFGVGFALGAMGLALGPIGFVVIAAVVGGGQLLLGQSGIQKRIRSSVVEGFGKELAKVMCKVEDNVRTGAMQAIDEMAGGLETAASGIIGQLDEQARRRVDQANLSAERAAARAEELATARNLLAARIDEILVA